MRIRNIAAIGLAFLAPEVFAGTEDPAVGGKWDPRIVWPFVPVAAANLPDGRILGWAGSERKVERLIGDGPERTYTGVWDPATGSFVQIQHPTHNMFCGHEVMLEDGSVMVTGGLNAGGSPWTSTFAYRTNQWVQREDMNRGRYYPTTVALPNGTVFTALGEGGGNTGELWDGASTWNLLSGVNLDAPILGLTKFVEREWFPHLQVAPDGRIFHSGPTPRMHMIDTSGVGSVTRVGPAISGWYPKDGISVMYDKGKILTAGGWVAGSDNRGSRRAMVIDINGAAPGITYIGNMNFPRRFANAVTLPNGEVAVIGGSRSTVRWGELNDTESVYAVELWNPTTQSFRVAASMSVPRNYHSVALLMVDGRVWSGGGGLCSCSRDHPDAEIWSPPYLFKANGTPAIRPELFSAPGVATVGSRIPVRGTANLRKFSLVKMSAVTHSINTDMRFLPAPFREPSSGEYTVDLDPNRNVLTPGFWMLFGLNGAGVPSVAKVIQVTTQEVSSGAPILSAIDGLAHLTNATIDLTLQVEEPDGDPLTFTATGLPQGVALGTHDGRLTGTLTSPGIYAVTLTVADTDGNDSTSFTWHVLDALSPIVIQPITAPPRPVNVPVAFTVSATGTPPLRYRWSYGDGSPLGTFTASPSRAYAYAAPGRYVVTVTVRDGLSVEQSVTFTQAIYRTQTVAAPAQDSTIIVENVTGTQRVWNVNPDAGTVAVINATTLTKIAEVTVGAKPSSLALGGDGWVWVTNKGSDTISRINPNGFAVAPPINLARGSQPHALVVDPVSGDALVVLEALGRLLRIDDASRAVIRQADIGAHVRHLSVSSDGGRIYVARFITPPLPGEDTAAPSLLRNGQSAGGEVLVLDGTNLSTITTVVLRHGNAATSEHSGPGLPNYLRAPTVSPDGLSAWVPSKQDNVLRGTLRNGQSLNHDHTVRAITSRIDLATLTADPVNGRIDFDDASVASAVAFDRTGSYLFVALEGNRTVVAVDAYRSEELFRFDAGRAPEGLVMDTAGRRLFVHNFMDRTVTVHDLSGLIDGGVNLETRLATISTVASETLSAQVLLGKQHFYDAVDERLASESYMSCAVCHHDGGQDGRTWDFTGFGEGLRNTITLDGQGGTANGPLHWTGNFDEAQDFEGQIRNFALGVGLMSDADFHTGTRAQPLGDPKAGLSPDLDALAAYVSSLNTVAKSPYRAGNGALTASAVAGKAVFGAIDVRHDIGTTLQPTSGGRLGGVLDGFDTPTLRGLWRTGPYLHDGAAATLGNAVDAHDGITLSATERSNLVDYLLSIDADEPAAGAPSAPKLEALMVTGVSSASWTTVPLAARYTSLIATCSIHQTNNVVAQLLRMRNVAADRFEIRLQNTSDGALVGEKVYCLAAEEGMWRLSDGRRFEARKYPSTRPDRAGRWVGEWRGSTRFTHPVVLGQVMSYNDARWSAFWSRGATANVPVDAANLFTGHMVGEDPVITRSSETIGYMIIEAGYGTANGIRYEANVGANSVRGWDNGSTGFPYYFSRSYPGPRVAIVAQAGTADVDGSFVSIRGATGLTATSLWLVADEDDNKDPERNHGTERVGYFVIDQPATLDLTPVP